MMRPLVRLIERTPMVPLVLLLTGCAASEASPDPTPQVVASMSILADLAEHVAGEDAEVTSLVPIGGDPHVHEPTPADARALQDADLVLLNGAGLEPWLTALLPTGVPALDVSATAGVDVRPDDDGVADPHLWMVPPNAATYVAVIAEALEELDPEHAEAYRERAAAYVDDLAALDAELRERLRAIPPQRRLLVTSHDAYRYFAEHYDIEVTGSVLGVSTEEDPSAGRVAQLIDDVRRLDVPAIFVESTVDPRVIERVARDAQVDIGDPLYGDSVGEPGSGAETYEDMLRANVEALVAGLAP